MVVRLKEIMGLLERYGDLIEKVAEAREWLVGMDESWGVEIGRVALAVAVLGERLDEGEEVI